MGRTSQRVWSHSALTGSQNFVLQAAPWKVENSVSLLFMLSSELCYCRNFTVVVLVLEASSSFGIQGLLEGPSAHL